LRASRQRSHAFWQAIDDADHEAADETHETNPPTPRNPRETVARYLALIDAVNGARAARGKE
jgi:hypothetical protein